MQCNILVIILSYNLILAALPKDICDRCVLKETCGFFGKLNANNQQSWMENFSCQSPDDEYGKLYAFGPTRKGDFICCSTTIWGTEDSESAKTKHGINDRRDENENYPRNNVNYLPQNYNQEPNKQPTASVDRELLGLKNINTNSIPNRTQNTYSNQNHLNVGIFDINNGIYNTKSSPLPTYGPSFGHGNQKTPTTNTPLDSNLVNRSPIVPNVNNNGKINLEGQCALMSFPSKLEAGCCGREASDGDRIIVAPTSPPLKDNITLKNEAPFDSSQEIPSWLTWVSQDKPGYRRRYRHDIVDITIESRIAGGKETELQQFPWTVLLKTTYDYGIHEATFNCGGSLISSRYILTAGHCVYDESGTIIQVAVYLAEYDKRSFPTDCKIVVGVGQKCVQNIVMYAEKVILHPQYDDLLLTNDIALIRLSNYAPYTEYIRPICLPPIDINDQEFPRWPLSVVGWGRNGTVQSYVKQSTVVNLVSLEQCIKYYPKIFKRQMCAVGYSGEDTCEGDSGGPLMTVYNGKYIVVGLVSGKRSDSDCGSPVPSLYTNVFVYLDWIRSNIHA